MRQTKCEIVDSSILSCSIPRAVPLRNSALVQQLPSGESNAAARLASPRACTSVGSQIPEKSTGAQCFHGNRHQLFLSDRFRVHCALLRFAMFFPAQAIQPIRLRVDKAGSIQIGYRCTTALDKSPRADLYFSTGKQSNLQRVGRFHWANALRFRSYRRYLDSESIRDISAPRFLCSYSSPADCCRQMQ